MNLQQHQIFKELCDSPRRCRYMLRHIHTGKWLEASGLGETWRDNPSYSCPVFSAANLDADRFDNLHLGVYCRAEDALPVRVFENHAGEWRDPAKQGWFLATLATQLPSVQQVAPSLWWEKSEQKKQQQHEYTQ